MSHPDFAFVQTAFPALSTRTVWTGSRPSVLQPVNPRPNTPIALSASHLRRALITHHPQHQQPNSSPNTLTDSFAAPNHRLQSLPVRFPTYLRPLRATLAFAARTAKRIATTRRRHATALRLARMGATFALAMATFFITRGSMSGVANIAAPALPPMPFKLMLPERLAAVLKPFTEAFGVVFLSEFGDKSMFATALMAMKYSPFIVCIGALAALTLMTFIACFLGQLMHLLPSIVTHYSTIALFVFFGLQMIMQSRELPDSPGGAGGERADAEEMVAGAAVAKVQSPMAILAKVSSLIFVAEWCDRSMLATMALAASSNTVAVIGGATLANVVCTGMAVCAATLVASRISERMVALTAGVLFEFFAIFTYLEGPEG